MKNIFKYIVTIIFFIINYYILNFLYIDENIKIYFIIAFLIIPIIYFMIKMKPNLMKYNNYMITIFIVLYFIGTLITGGFSLYKNIMDLKNPISISVNICGKSLHKGFNYVKGEMEYKYQYSFCKSNNNDSVFLKSSIPVSSSTFELNQTVNVTYVKGSKIITDVSLNQNNYTKPYDYWYLLFIIFVGYLILHTYNKNNISTIQERQLTEEEEYILRLMGKRKEVQKKTLTEKIKSVFKKNNKEDTPNKED